MKKVKFVLNNTLLELGISHHRLAKEAGIRPNAIYDIRDNKKKTISLEDLGDILNALSKIAREEGIKREFDIDDVIIYQ